MNMTKVTGNLYVHAISLIQFHMALEVKSSSSDGALQEDTRQLKVIEPILPEQNVSGVERNFLERLIMAAINLKATGLMWLFLP